MVTLHKVKENYLYDFFGFFFCLFGCLFCFFVSLHLLPQPLGPTGLRLSGVDGGHSRMVLSEDW